MESIKWNSHREFIPVTPGDTKVLDWVNSNQRLGSTLSGRAQNLSNVKGFRGSTKGEWTEAKIFPFYTPGVKGEAFYKETGF